MRGAFRRCLACLACAAVASGSHQQFIHTVGVLLEKHRAGELNDAQINLTEAVRSLAAATPGCKPKEALSSVVNEIKSEVDPKIKAGHGATQASINEAADALSTSASNALRYKTNADNADDEWFNCVRREKALLLDVEQRKQKVKIGRLNEAEPCQQAEDMKTYSFNMNQKLDFECDIAQYGNCNHQLSNYENQIKYMIASVKSDVKEKEAVYSQAESACEAARADVVQKQSAHDDALKAWRDQRGDCRRMDAQREEAMCLFGSAMQRKCALDLPAYRRLIEQVDSTGNVDSHSDRLQEWKTAHVTKCILTTAMNGKELDDAALTGCVESANYDAHVGKLKKQTQFVESLLTPQKFTCDDQQAITFRGKAWEVPEKEDLASSDYVLVDSFTPTLSTGGGNVPFEFCTGFCEVVGVGSSSANTKTAALPQDDMHCSDDPFNTQQPHWNDEFSIEISEKTASVQRLDYAGGWGQDLTLKCCAVPKPTAPGRVSAKSASWRIVEVGNSNGNIKTVSLPISGLRCSEVPQNPQNRNWRDIFKVTTDGDKLHVQRMDVHHGWGQHLQLKCH